jgi:hypothetical protein
MLNKHRRMRLSREEENFLRHWIHDEVHYLKGVGPAKRLQVEHKVRPGDLAIIIAAAIPDTAEQAAAGFGPPPPSPPAWPWSEDGFHSRLAEAKTLLGLGAAELSRS